jgi:fructose/tagatose bisphosphate aldolase
VLQNIRKLQLNYKKFNLGVGTMSRDIVDALLQYSHAHSYPILLIASRNQVDSTGGYAFTTSELAEFCYSHPAYCPSRVLLCRDHCGPYFCDSDANLDLDSAVSACKRTISADISAGFQLIHVDVSRVPASSQVRVARELFEHAIQLSPDIHFEYGTEDNSIDDPQNAIDSVLAMISIAREFAPHVQYISSRTGSLTKQTQVGSFKRATVTSIAHALHERGILFKEHNADYLNRDAVRLRKECGVDALNVAPQLARLQSDCIAHYMRDTPQFARFYDLVLASKHWTRWCTPDVRDARTKYSTSAHYSMNTGEWAELYAAIPKDFRWRLHITVSAALDEYRLGWK